MVDKGLISEFERSLSSQEGPVWYPVGASLWAPKFGYSCQLCFNHVSAKPAAWSSPNPLNLLRCQARRNPPLSFRSLRGKSETPPGEPAAAPELEDSSAKIAALYATLPTIQDLQPLLPVVLERLRSLQVLHAHAASAKGDMDDVEKQQAATSREIERWRKGLADVEAKMVQYQTVMEKNTEEIGKTVEDVEERLARLETQ
jgi:hypothetical protein